MLTSGKLGLIAVIYLVSSVLVDPVTMQMIKVNGAFFLFAWTMSTVFGDSREGDEACMSFMMCLVILGIFFILLREIA